MAVATSGVSGVAAAAATKQYACRWSVGGLKVKGSPSWKPTRTRMSTRGTMARMYHVRSTCISMPGRPLLLSLPFVPVAG